MAKGLQGPEWFPGGMSPLSLAESGISGLAAPTPFPLLCPPLFAQNKQLLSLWLRLASQRDRQSQHQVITPLTFCYLNIPSQMETKQCGGTRKGKAPRLTTHPQLVLTLPRPSSVPCHSPVRIPLPSWFCGDERTVSWAHRCKGEVGDQQCSPQDLCRQGDSLSPDYMPDSWEHSLCRVQGLPAFTCLLPTLGGVVVSSP